MYKNILVPVDLGEKSSWERSVPFAVDFALHYGAHLYVMTVVPDYGFHYVSQFFPPGYEQGMLEKAKTILEKFVGEHVPKDITVQHIVAHGSIYREIVKAAERIDADAIIMASHRPEYTDYVIGPNAERVLHQFKRSVFVIGSNFSAGWNK